jgi:toxin ParE1/3/4
MNSHFHPEARKEFLASIDYYEKCKPGLGLEFAQEVYSAIDRIGGFPEAWPSISLHARRCLINRFPFGVLYRFDQREIIILAIMELHRKPGYWKKRNK